MRKPRAEQLCAGGIDTLDELLAPALHSQLHTDRALAMLVQADRSSAVEELLAKGRQTAPTRTMAVAFALDVQLHDNLAAGDIAAAKATNKLLRSESTMKGAVQLWHDHFFQVRLAATQGRRRETIERLGEYLTELEAVGTAATQSEALLVLAELSIVNNELEEAARLLNARLTRAYVNNGNVVWRKRLRSQIPGGLLTAAPRLHVDELLDEILDR